MSYLTASHVLRTSTHTHTLGCQNKQSTNLHRVSTLYIICKRKKMLCILMLGLGWLRWLLACAFSSSPSWSPSPVTSSLSTVIHWRLSTFLISFAPCSPPQVSKDQYHCTARFPRLHCKQLRWAVAGDFFSWHSLCLTYLIEGKRP